MGKLWIADAATFAGDFFTSDEACCYPKPVRPGGVPILVGGEIPLDEPGIESQFAEFAETLVGPIGEL